MIALRLLRPSQKASVPSALFAYEEEESFVNVRGREFDRLLKDMKREGFRAGVAGAFVADAPKGTTFGRVVALGLGARKESEPDVLRRAGGRLARVCRERRFQEALVEWPLRGLEGDPEEALRAFLQGVQLGAYRYDVFRNPPPGEKPTDLKVLLLRVPPSLAPAAKRLVSETKAYTEATFLVRDLVNGPPSRTTPRVLVEAARRVARENRLFLKVYGKTELKRMGMEALLGVNRGSSEEPYLIHLRYRPAGGARRRVALVGKGITFDSGGLSLKPAGSMETMKMDMAGAAAVIGAFSRIAVFRPRVEVHGVVATTENMPGSAAYKPGDVLRAFNGKTIEVLNTDAEGRVILADALSYAARQKPDEIVDMATLTGAVIVALGTRVTGAMTNSPTLLSRVKAAMEREGEAVWELPMPRDYREDIRSRIADIKNLGTGREAGTIAGAMFLREFVEDAQWVHLDIAGTAYYEKDYPTLPHTPYGATGVMTRSLLTFLRDS